MRQVGILAAACLHALDHHLARLAEDHARARRLAAGFRAVPGVRVPEPETNIVFVELEDESLSPPALLEALRAEGVWLGQFGARRLRAIVHMDVDDAAVERAVIALGACVRALSRRARA